MNQTYRARVAVVLCLTAVSLSQTSSEQRQMPSPLSLFQQAHALSSNFSPDDRAFVLLRIADGVRAIDVARCKKWSLELFEVSQNSLTSNNRRAMQKNAIVGLSSVD